MRRELALTSINMRKTWRAAAMTVLIMLMAAFKTNAEVPTALRSNIGLCNIASNYALVAFKEKELAKDDLAKSAESAFTLMLYAVSKDKTFDKMSIGEQKTFIGFVSDIYQYAFFTDDLTIDNVEEKALSHCRDRVGNAWHVINKKAMVCQKKGRLSEMVAKFKSKGRSRAFTHRILANGMVKGSVAAIELEGTLDKVFNDKLNLVPSMHGRLKYKECLRAK